MCYIRAADNYYSGVHYTLPPLCWDFISRPKTNSLVSKYLNTVALMQLSSELERAEDGFCTHLVKARSESLDTTACIWAFCCSICIAACREREAEVQRGGGGRRKLYMSHMYYYGLHLSNSVHGPCACTRMSFCRCTDAIVRNAARIALGREDTLTCARVHRNINSGFRSYDGDFLQLKNIPCQPELRLSNGFVGLLSASGRGRATWRMVRG